MVVKFLFLMVIVSFVGCLTLVGHSHEGASGVTKQRMAGMKIMANSVKSLHAIVSGKSKLDAEKVRAYTAAIRREGGPRLLKLFPEGSMGYPSEATPQIWGDWPAFVKLVGTLSQAVDEIDASLTADKPSMLLPGAFKKLSRVCSNCHKRFRKKKIISKLF